MAATTVSTGNPFFHDVGLLVKGPGGHIPADDVFEFSRAYEWNPEKAATKLAPLLKRSWFGERLLAKLSFRSMSEEEAIAELADEVHAGPKFKMQIEMVLEFLDITGLVFRENGRVSLGPMAKNGDSLSEESDQNEQKLEKVEPSNAGKGDAIDTSSAQQVSPLLAQGGSGAVQFSVNINVDMSELSGWEADRIAAFFSGLAQVISAKKGE